MNNIVYLDADFVIKTSKIQVGSSTLFDKILELPYSFRINNKVLSEIKFNLNKKIQLLILNGKISNVKVCDCFFELSKTFDDKAIENMVLSTIKNIILEVCEEDTELYDKYFKRLEVNALFGDELSHFSNEFENIIKSIPKDNNIGEITTLLDMSLTNRLENVNVISLLSHDSSAKRCASKLHENINSFDCYSCFHLLKIEAILSFEEAKSFVKKWESVYPLNKKVKIIENSGSKIIDFINYITYIYKNNNYIILRNGILRKIS